MTNQETLADYHVRKYHYRASLNAMLPTLYRRWPSAAALLEAWAIEEQALRYAKRKKALCYKLLYGGTAPLAEVLE